MGLGAPHDDAVGPAFDDVQVEVGVDLLRRRLGAIALGVGHRAVGDQVVLLQVAHVLVEAVVVTGALGLVESRT